MSAVGDGPHPEVSNRREVIRPTQDELRTFRDLAAEIADAMAGLHLPWLDNYVRCIPGELVVVGREVGAAAGRLFVTYRELPLSLASNRTCYRIDETDGAVNLGLEQGSTLDDTLIVPRQALLDGGSVMVDQTLAEAASLRQADAELEALVPGLGPDGISAADIDRVVADLTTSWAIRRVELGLP